MIIFSVLYPNEPGKRFDMDYYCNKHIALVKEKVGDALKGVSVEKGLSGAAPGSSATYAAVCHLRFESMDDLAVMGALSPIFDADVPNFTDLTPQFQVSEEVL